MYENGKFVEQDMKKALKYYEKSAEIGNLLSHSVLAKWAEFGFGSMQVDTERAARHLLYCVENGETCAIELLENFVLRHKLVWSESLHRYWNALPLEDGGKLFNLNDQIVSLLLVSKNRRSSNLQYVQFLVNGVVMLIVKHLCHLRQQIVI